MDDLLDKEKLKLQTQLVNLWWKKGCRGTLELATGVGKTMCGLIAARHLIDSYGVEEIVVVTPSEPIRDEVWPAQIAKHIGEKYLPKFRIECIQTLYKERGNVYPFVIADEIHNYMPIDTDFLNQEREWIKFFTENKMLKVMGLSAFVPKNRKIALDKIAPVVYTIDIDDAEQRGLISNYKIYTIPIQLKTEEQDEYDVIQREYSELEVKLGGSLVAYENSNSILKAYGGGRIYSETKEVRAEYAVAFKFRERMNTRRLYLNNSLAKIEACNQIVDAYPSKCIVFSASKEFANALNKSREEHENTAPIHSGISKLKRAKYLTEFAVKDSWLRVLSAVQAINEGLDVPMVKMSVLAGGNAKRLELLQRLGRNMRLDGIKEAVMAMLYHPDTQDENWMYSRLYGINKEKVIKVKSVQDFLLILNNFKKWQDEKP